MDGWLDEWLDGWMAGWLKGWMGDKFLKGIVSSRKGRQTSLATSLPLVLVWFWFG